MKHILVTGSFDDLRSRHVRFLDAASRIGNVHLLLWSDALIKSKTGAAPKFPLTERQYLVSALRYVSRVTPVDSLEWSDTLVRLAGEPVDVWVDDETEADPARAAFSSERGIEYTVLRESNLPAFPVYQSNWIPSSTGRRKVVVTGCFDWFHSGHVRFFEEVSQLGDLYVVVGSDENVRLLKGPGHPLYSEEERRYMVASVRYVTGALISTGSGWMDAEPEIDLLQPDLYAVNEDGDKPEKRAFCDAHGIDYVVLTRLPKEGLPRRESTHLRGF